MPTKKTTKKAAPKAKKTSAKQKAARAKFKKAALMQQEMFRSKKGISWRQAGKDAFKRVYG